MRIVDQFLRDSLGWSELIDAHTGSGYSASLSQALAPRRTQIPAVQASLPTEFVGLGDPNDAEVAAR